MILAAPQLDVSTPSSSTPSDSDNAVSDDAVVITEVKEESSGSNSNSPTRGGGFGGGILGGIFNLITGGFRVAQDEVGSVRVGCLVVFCVVR